MRRIQSLLRTKGVEIEIAGPQGHANARMMYITARIEVARKTPVAPLAPVAINGAGKGSVPSAPKDVVLEEDEVYDAED